MRHIDPRTSRVQSECSTIWATSPYYFLFELSFEQIPWNISFRFVRSCKFLPIISKHKIELSKPRKCFGDAAHRFPYFSLAKRVLYHLSYIPVFFKLWASLWTNLINFQFCSSHLTKLILEALENVLEMRGIDPRTECEASTLPSELHPRLLQALS